jgi:hypothetical protein
VLARLRVRLSVLLMVGALAMILCFSIALSWLIQHPGDSDDTHRTGIELELLLISRVLDSSFGTLLFILCGGSLLTASAAFRRLTACLALVPKLGGQSQWV